MNSRLTIQDLAGLLAERTGKDKGSAEQFLREFIAIVSQGVVTDKVVKIKGLGTFKIVLVEKRESVHVHTGERFVIPSHYKFSFLPDKELREQTNKPFAFFETTELNDDVDFSDLDVSTETEEKEAEDESEEEIVSEVKEKVLESPVLADDKVKSEEASPGISTLEVEQSSPEEPDDKIVDLHKSSRWIKMLVPVIVILMITATGLFVYQKRDLFLGAKTTPLVRNDKTTAIPIDSIIEEKPSLSVDTSAIALSPTDTLEQAEDTFTTANTATSEVIAKVKIEPGSRLTLISLEYYGSKIFWVYLYDYNKSSIKDPNNVPMGTEILVPAPSVYGIDKQSRTSVEKAAARQTEILTGNL